MNIFSNIISPLDQFEIRNLISLDAPVLGNLSISLTNIGLYLTIAGFLVFIISLLSNNNNRVVSNAWSVYQESIYATVHGIVVGQMNDKKGQVYFPLAFIIAFSGLELGIAFIQAQVFIVLSCSYIKGALDLH